MTTSSMIVRVIPKRDTQAMIKALRDADLDVIKDSSGMYHCSFYRKIEGKEKQVKLFTAMPGRRGYLVRMRADLFA